MPFNGKEFTLFVTPHDYERPIETISVPGILYPIEEFILRHGMPRQSDLKPNEFDVKSLISAANNSQAKFVHTKQEFWNVLREMEKWKYVSHRGGANEKDHHQNYYQLTGFGMKRYYSDIFQHKPQE
ncbi:MAG TPA: hypothetical protein VLF68_03840 [Candidatus Saccharimonadales bacterium]|nr:hypothetical protein [Candidatus Saccharimonadales bacterium]